LQFVKSLHKLTDLCNFFADFLKKVAVFEPKKGRFSTLKSHSKFLKWRFTILKCRFTKKYVKNTLSKLEILGAKNFFVAKNRKIRAKNGRFL